MKKIPRYEKRKEVTEEWARHAPAGPELDWICAMWLGLKLHRGITLQDEKHNDHPIWADPDPWQYEPGKSKNPYGVSFVSPSEYWGPGNDRAHPPQFSKLTLYAYALRRVMKATPEKVLGRYVCRIPWSDVIDPEAATSELATARTCGVLTALGITREMIP